MLGDAAFHGSFPAFSLKQMLMFLFELQLPPSSQEWTQN